MTVYIVRDRHRHYLTTCTRQSQAETLAAAVGGTWRPIVRKRGLGELHLDERVAA